MQGGQNFVVKLLMVVQRLEVLKHALFFSSSLLCFDLLGERGEVIWSPSGYQTKNKKLE
jgi:hypothetical protein